MKFFAFIMALLVLVLGMLPCADANEMHSSAKTEISKQSQHKDTQQQDDCSPFCQCTCCAGFFINHPIAFAATLPLFQTERVGSSLSADVLEVALPIWQPPQLV